MVPNLEFAEYFNEEYQRWEEAHPVEDMPDEIREFFEKALNVRNEHMQINEYQKLALRTEPPTDNWRDRITNGLMGLNGEAGEAIDLLKKHFFHGHDLDFEHLAKELGDVAWYIAVTADAIGYTLEDIFQMNIDKLRNRYPDGFDSERSQHRAEGDV